MGNLNGIEMRRWTPEETEAIVKDTIAKTDPGGEDLFFPITMVKFPIKFLKQHYQLCQRRFVDGENMYWLGQRIIKLEVNTENSDCFCQ